MATNNKQPNSVLQEWVMYLSWKQQTGLISAIRGNDQEPENDDIKKIVRAIRYLVLNNADNKTTFMSDEVLNNSEVLNCLHTIRNKISDSKDEVLNKTITSDPSFTQKEIKVYYSHWYDHIIMAITTIAKEHPNNYVRCYWSKINNELK